MHDQDTGTLLRRLRLERGWTQRQAAELLGVSAQAVSKWERGLSYPDVTLLEPLAAALDLTVEELMAWAARTWGCCRALRRFLASAWREFWTETCFRRRRMEEI